MRFWAVSLWFAALAGCATAPPPRIPDGLFRDAAFRPASERIRAEDVFALSDDMKQYLRAEIAPQVLSKGPRQGLLEAIAKKGDLRLEYDSMITRNAAQAFAARSGNCLSLVIMTASFAKALELPVRYQNVVAEETVSRSGNIELFIGHVNLSLGDRAVNLGPGRRDDLMTIDFLPPQEAAGLSVRPIAEETVVAMYFNNRAAEAFARGQVDDAYWWARAAIGQDPRFLSSYNTLGVVYHRHGNLAEAERAFNHVLEGESTNPRAMSNLVRVLDDSGRPAEARLLAAKLRQVDPNPPFRDFDRGLEALRNGQLEAARDLFAREVDRAPYYHEFRFWLGIAYQRLGDLDRARKQLALAVEYATTRNDHDLYAAKLDRIKSIRVQ